jgi:hypothetical protein
MKTNSFLDKKKLFSSLFVLFMFGVFFWNQYVQSVDMKRLGVIFSGNVEE